MIQQQIAILASDIPWSQFSRMSNRFGWFQKLMISSDSSVQTVFAAPHDVHSEEVVYREDRLWVLRSRLVGMGNEDLALMDQDALLAEKERLLILQEKCRQTMLPLSRGKHREASPELAEQKREYDRIFGRLGVLEKLLAKGR
jgi:hypothetical protein